MQRKQEKNNSLQQKKLQIVKHVEKLYTTFLPCISHTPSPPR